MRAYCTSNPTSVAYSPVVLGVGWAVARLICDSARKSIGSVVALSKRISSEAEQASERPLAWLSDWSG